MSFSGDSEANGLYTLSVLFRKKHIENPRKQVHETIHLFYSSQLPAKKNESTGYYLQQFFSS